MNLVVSFKDKREKKVKERQTNERKEREIKEKKEKGRHPQEINYGLLSSWSLRTNFNSIVRRGLHGKCILIIIQLSPIILKE